MTTNFSATSTLATSSTNLPSVSSGVNLREKASTVLKTLTDVGSSVFLAGIDFANNLLGEEEPKPNEDSIWYNGYEIFIFGDNLAFHSMKINQLPLDSSNTVINECSTLILCQIKMQKNVPRKFIQVFFNDNKWKLNFNGFDSFIEIRVPSRTNTSNISWGIISDLNTIHENLILIEIN